MPYVAAWAVQTPHGNAAATLRTLSAASAGQPGRLDDAPLLPRLIALGQQVCSNTTPDLLLFASTKGDLPLYLDALLAGEATPNGGLHALALALGRHFGCPAQAVSVACASGTAALAQAGRALRTGTAHRVLVLSGERLHPFIGEGFAALRALASGPCRPFDAERDGLCLGEGLAAMLLCADTLTDQTPGLRLLGWGQSADANHLTGPHRDGRGLRAACAAAISMGGQQPALIVGHGTGTRYNDDAESMAYSALCPAVQVVGWKGLLGHTLGAAGLLESALACELIATGVATPGTVNLRTPGTAGDVRLLPAGAQAPCAGPVLVANAGFGGLNAAVLIGHGAALAPHTTAPRTPQHTLELHHDGWQCLGDATRTAWHEPAAPGQLPRLGGRELGIAGDAGWGRMDLLCRTLVVGTSLLAKRSGPLPAQTAVVVWTSAGCAATDLAYEQTRRSTGMAEAQRFPYTLPSTALGEASIRCGLTGTMLCLLGEPQATSDDALLAALFAEGQQAVVIATVADTSAVLHLHRA